MPGKEIPPFLRAIDWVRNLLGGAVLTCLAIAFLMLGHLWGRIIGAAMLIPVLLAGVAALRTRRARATRDAE
jgi:hypothetical protein